MSKSAQRSAHPCHVVDRILNDKLVERRAFSLVQERSGKNCRIWPIGIFVVVALKFEDHSIIEFHEFVEIRTLEFPVDGALCNQGKSFQFLEIIDINPCGLEHESKQNKR